MNGNVVVVQRVERNGCDQDEFVHASVIDTAMLKPPPANRNGDSLIWISRRRTPGGQKPMLTVRFVVDLKARGAHCCAVAHGLACCPTVLTSLLPCRWPALRACFLADQDVYTFVYYGINPNIVGGKEGGPWVWA